MAVPAEGVLPSGSPFAATVEVPPLEVRTDAGGLTIRVMWPETAVRTAQALPLSVTAVDIEVRVPAGVAATARVSRKAGKNPVPVRIPLAPGENYRIVGKAYRVAPDFGQPQVPVAEAVVENVAIGRGEEKRVALSFRLTDPPVLTEVAGDGVLRPGEVVTLRGSGFGTTHGDKPILVSFGGNVSAEVTWVGSDSIEVTVPHDLETTSGGTVSAVAALVDGVRSYILGTATAVRNRLAPDDTQSASSHHDYTLTKDGVASTFVWVPVFKAYQIIRPAEAGLPDAPVGQWVKDKPTMGVPTVAWAAETFGGFYAGKYESSRTDATPWDPLTGSSATVGTAPGMKVARYCVPWGAVTWTEADELSRNLHPNAALLLDEQWTALAVWATIHGVKIVGNSLGNVSSDDPDTTFEAGVSGYSGALTGSGRNAAWTGAQNLTSHTGTDAGVMDLVGNIDEWTDGIGVGPGSPGQAKWTYRGQELAVAATIGGTFIQTMSTMPGVRRLGLPATVAYDPPSPVWAGDYFYGAGANSLSGEAHARRGGGDARGGSAGLWCTYVANDFTARISDHGFRTALTF
ncbi:MAG: hypothetical protein VKP57_09115 [Candidatus Sericytochromatia bacterium]|nr:hypothetical protein [Candidatus Sericytochromatia bacterium]